MDSTLTWSTHKQKLCNRLSRGIFSLPRLKESVGCCVYTVPSFIHNIIFFLLLYLFTLQGWFFLPGLSEGSHLYRRMGSVLEIRHLVRGYNWGGGPVPRPGGLTWGLCVDGKRGRDRQGRGKEAAVALS